MAGFLRIMGVLGLVIAYMSISQQRSLSATYTSGHQEAQIGFVMRLYHQQAIAFKQANPALTGTLLVSLPSVLSGGNFAFCADTKNVATYTTIYTTSEASRIAAALSTSPGGAGIGLSNGSTITTAYGTINGACVLPMGAAVIQTKVLP